VGDFADFVRTGTPELFLSFVIFGTMRGLEKANLSKDRLAEPALFGKYAKPRV
jgi:hypothetical protein